MLKRQNRLRTRADIEQLYRRGRQAQAATFVVKAGPNGLGQSRVAVVVSTKVSKKAVVRNRIRRRLSGLFERHWTRIKPAQDLVVIVRQDIHAAPIEELEAQLLSCLSTLGALH